jgi:hypothetical protein
MEATSESHAPNVPVKRKASDRSRGHPRPHPLDRADPPRRDRRRQVAGHLEHLSEIRDHRGNARERLEAVLGAYALMTYERPTAPSSQRSCTGASASSRHISISATSSGTCWPRRQRQATSGTISRLASLPATASTPSRQPAACHRRPRSAGSSRSPLPGCTPGLTRNGQPGGCIGQASVCRSGRVGARSARSVAPGVPRPPAGR